MNVVTRTMLIHSKWRTLSVVSDMVLIALVVTCSLILRLAYALHNSALGLAEICGVYLFVSFSNRCEASTSAFAHSATWYRCSLLLNLFSESWKTRHSSDLGLTFIL